MDISVALCSTTAKVVEKCPQFFILQCYLHWEVVAATCKAEKSIKRCYFLSAYDLCNIQEMQIE